MLQILHMVDGKLAGTSSIIKAISKLFLASYMFCKVGQDLLSGFQISLVYGLRRPPLYITYNLLKYWAIKIWSGTSYYCLLGIFLSLLSHRVFILPHRLHFLPTLHPLHFLPVSPSSNVLLGHGFTFSEKWLPLGDALRTILLRFPHMWIMITKGCLGL